MLVAKVCMLGHFENRSLSTRTCIGPGARARGRCISNRNYRLSLQVNQRLRGSETSLASLVLVSEARDTRVASLRALCNAL